MITLILLIPLFTGLFMITGWEIIADIVGLLTVIQLFFSVIMMSQMISCPQKVGEVIGQLDSWYPQANRVLSFFLMSLGVAFIMFGTHQLIWCAVSAVLSGIWLITFTLMYWNAYKYG